MSSKVIVNDHSQECIDFKNEAILRALEKIGITAEGDVKEKITEPKMHKWGDEKHPKLRGSVDTGRLRNSIAYKVEGSEQKTYVGTNVEYAKYVEYGTSRAPAYPFLKNTVAENSGKYKKIVENELKGVN